ncbi:MAG: preprotein translocase subunit YajC [Bryobacteraceae bacterium]|nr:preprotein translocase subunit YajC [Bryobacteraceae bacterium]
MILALILLQATTAPAANPVIQFVPILAIFAIFYFLLLRPMQKQRKDQQQMLANLQTGHTVVTSGGIIGTIVSLSDDHAVIRVKPDNVKLQVTRSSVAGLVQEEKQ